MVSFVRRRFRPWRLRHLHQRFDASVLIDRYQSHAGRACSSGTGRGECLIAAAAAKEDQVGSTGPPAPLPGSRHRAPPRGELVRAARGSSSGRRRGTSSCADPKRPWRPVRRVHKNRSEAARTRRPERLGVIAPFWYAQRKNVHAQRTHVRRRQASAAARCRNRARPCALRRAGAHVSTRGDLAGP